MTLYRCALVELEPFAGDGLKCIVGVRELRRRRYLCVRMRALIAAASSDPAAVDARLKDESRLALVSRRETQTDSAQSSGEEVPLVLGMLDRELAEFMKAYAVVIQ
jgi:hypothetical protein